MEGSFNGDLIQDQRSVTESQVSKGKSEKQRNKSPNREFPEESVQIEGPRQAKTVSQFSEFSDKRSIISSEELFRKRSQNYSEHSAKDKSSTLKPSQDD